MTRKHKWAMILIALVAVLMLVVITTIVYKEKLLVKEGFANSVTQPALSEYRSSLGLEKCDILKSSNLGGNAGLMAKKYVDGIRLYKYKSDDGEELPKNIERCFIYDDEENKVKDSMMVGEPCNKDRHTKFKKNAPFITRMYNDTKVTSTHTYPVNKCIIEIDKTKVTDEALTTYWNGIGYSQCEEIYNQLRDELEKCKKQHVYNQTYFGDIYKTLKESNDDLKKRLGELKDKLNALLKEYHEINVPAMQVCNTESGRLDASIKALNDEIERLITEIDKANKEAILKRKDFDDTVKLKLPKILDMNENYSECKLRLDSEKRKTPELVLQSKREKEYESMLTGKRGELLGIRTAYSNVVVDLLAKNAHYNNVVIPTNSTTITQHKDAINALNRHIDVQNKNITIQEDYRTQFNACLPTLPPLYDEVNMQFAIMESNLTRNVVTTGLRNACYAWSNLNGGKVETEKTAYGTCMSNRTIVQKENKACQEELTSCTSNLNSVKLQIEEKRVKIQANTSKIVDLTNQLLACRNKVTVKKIQSIRNIQSVENKVPPKVCMSTKQLDRDIGSLESKIEVILRRPPPKTVVECGNAGQIYAKCKLIDPSGCSPPPPPRPQLSGMPTDKSVDTDRFAFMTCTHAGGNNVTITATGKGKSAGVSVPITVAAGQMFNMCPFGGALVDNTKCVNESFKCDLIPVEPPAK